MINPSKKTTLSIKCSFQKLNCSKLSKMTYITSFFSQKKITAPKISTSQMSCFNSQHFPSTPWVPQTTGTVVPPMKVYPTQKKTLLF